MPSRYELLLLALGHRNHDAAHDVSQQIKSGEAGLRCRGGIAWVGGLATGCVFRWAAGRARGLLDDLGGRQRRWAPAPGWRIA